MVRAEGVTPLTRSGNVSLPKQAIWRDAFVNELAEFPLGQHDLTWWMLFVHGCKAFVSSGDFKALDLQLIPGSLQLSARAREDAILEMARQEATPGIQFVLAGIRPCG